MLRCIDWHGLQAVEFGKGDYEALLIPGFGANLVRLANVRLGVEILRTPAADEIETFKGRPHVFGLPVLFPPNRIADGTFTFGGRTCPSRRSRSTITTTESSRVSPSPSRRRGRRTRRYSSSAATTPMRATTRFSATSRTSSSARYPSA